MLVLSRQATPVFDRSVLAPPEVGRGAYVLADCEGTPEVLLLATGSEVALCLQAREELAQDNIRARVISMPSWELFESQGHAYREQVLPPAVTARVSVEPASTFGWDRYVGRLGHRLGLETFGASAPLAELQKKFGFTVENIVAAAKDQILIRRG